MKFVLSLAVALLLCSTVEARGLFRQRTKAVAKTTTTVKAVAAGPVRKRPASRCVNGQCPF